MESLHAVARASFGAAITWGSGMATDATTPSQSARVPGCQGARVLRCQSAKCTCKGCACGASTFALSHPSPFALWHLGPLAPRHLGTLFQAAGPKYQNINAATPPHTAAKPPNPSARRFQVTSSGPLRRDISHDPPAAAAESPVRTYSASRKFTMTPTRAEPPVQNHSCGTVSCGTST